MTRFREDDENFSKHLKEILVPIETVSEVKNGQKKQRDRKFYPGYVFVEMHLFDTEGNLLKEPWYKVKDTDGVINFIGRSNPTPLREDEIGRGPGRLVVVEVRRLGEAVAQRGKVQRDWLDVAALWAILIPTWPSWLSFVPS